MYTNTNFRTKKQLKEAIAAGVGNLGVYQPGPFGGSEPSDGWVTLEGPHYPEAHKWYAKARLVNGQIVEVK